MTILSTTILLPQIHFHAHHGVMPQERLVGAQFTVSLEIATRFDEALQADCLEGTISYADIHAAVKDEMSTPSALLEHVAGRIARRLLQDFPTIDSLKIEVMKQNPPMGADIPAAGVRIEVKR